MTHYYFNQNKDLKGNHEVHTGSCSYLQAVENREYIGSYNNCSEALTAAKRLNPSKSFDGCIGVVETATKVNELNIVCSNI